MLRDSEIAIEQAIKLLEPVCLGEFCDRLDIKDMCPVCQAKLWLLLAQKKEKAEDERQLKVLKDWFAKMPPEERVAQAKWILEMSHRVKEMK